MTKIEGDRALLPFSFFFFSKTKKVLMGKDSQNSSSIPTSETAPGESLSFAFFTFLVGGACPHLGSSLKDLFFYSVVTWLNVWGRLRHSSLHEAGRGCLRWFLRCHLHFRLRWSALRSPWAPHHRVPLFVRLWWSALCGRLYCSSLHAGRSQDVWLW